MDKALVIFLAENGTDVAPEGGAKISGRRVPKSEVRLLAYGTNETDYGPLEFNEEDGAALMEWYGAKYTEREGVIDIDLEHSSRKKDATPEEKESSGRLKLELRDDGLWAVDLTYQPEVYEKIASDKIRSFSVVVGFDATGHVLSLRQIGLTNQPAAYGAGLLAASVSGFKKYPVMEGKWSAAAADKRLREKLSSDGTGDLDTVPLDRYRAAHVFYDNRNLDNTTAYKGLICDVEDGKIKLHKGAIQALAGAMQGARGGLKVSDTDMEKGKALLSRYYELWEGSAPWDREEAKMAEGTDSPVVDLGIRVSIVALMEQYGLKEKMSMVDGLVKSTFGDMAYMKDMYPEEGGGHYLLVCKYNENYAGEKVYKVPLKMEGDDYALGEAVEGYMKFMPKQEHVMLTETLEKADVHTAQLNEIFKAAKVETATQVVTRLEALGRVESGSVELSERLAKLEVDRVNREKIAILAEAKSSGRWSADQEKQANRVCALAEKCGDDVVAEYKQCWEAAPVITGQSTVTPGKQPGQSKTAQLTEDQKASAARFAPSFGMTPEQMEEKMAANLN